MVKRWCLVAMAMVIAGCSGGGGPIGGVDDLPPDVPDGVEFAEPDAEAPLAPEFSAVLVDGTEIELADLWSERPVVMLFTASWCGPCAEQHEMVDGIVESYDDAVAMVVIAEDGDDGLEEYLADVEVRRPVAVVPISTWDTYAVAEPPLVALVGPGGHLLRGWPGGVAADVLTEQLDALVVGAGGEGGG